jgi:hypothetical protein
VTWGSPGKFITLTSATEGVVWFEAGGNVSTRAGATAASVVTVVSVAFVASVAFVVVAATVVTVLRRGFSLGLMAVREGAKLPASGVAVKEESEFPLTTSLKGILSNWTQPPKSKKARKRLKAKIARPSRG